MTKVVVHVDEVAKVAMAIGNVTNLLTEMPTAEVVVVVNGPAITTLTTDQWQPLLTQLPQVELDACANAMRSHQLTAGDLPGAVRIVPAGVVRLVALQTRGYAYLKP